MSDVDAMLDDGARWADLLRRDQLRVALAKALRSMGVSEKFINGSAIEPLVCAAMEIRP